MSKIKFLNHNLLSKTNLAVFLALVMLASFLGSRSILSISMVLFGVNALRDVHPKRWLQQKWWLLGLVWVLMYAVSWFWSSNKDEWNTYTQIKLPFLLLPLAFAFLPQFSLKQLRVFTIVFNLLMLSGISFSLSFFLKNPQYYIHSYDLSGVLPTPGYNDHISFSEIIALAIMWNVYCWPSILSKAGKWFSAVCILFFVAYLHFLAAKTGLVAFYLFVVGCCIYLAFRKNALLSVGLLVLLVAGFFLANKYIPTFHGRLNYMHYTYTQYKDELRSGDYGDIGRVISYDLAGKVIKQHPVVGVGAGDMLDDMKKAYDVWYPQIPDQQRLLPHNQFLTIAVGTGIPSLLFFIWWLIAPFSRMKKNRDSAFFVIAWLMLLVLLMVDPILEVQMGVFVFLFFFLWQRHTLKIDDEKIVEKDKMARF